MSCSPVHPDYLTVKHFVICTTGTKKEIQKPTSHVLTLKYLSTAEAILTVIPCPLNSSADMLRGFTQTGLASVGPLCKDIFR